MYVIVYTFLIIKSLRLDGTNPKKKKKTTPEEIIQK